ncbi:MAG: hypothetical protein JSW07_04490 [bacterium]|nr:MAG: hypothetical protein JSW07_04490 [bacterium]
MQEQLFFVIFIFIIFFITQALMVPWKMVSMIELQISSIAVTEKYLGETFSDSRYGDILIKKTQEVSKPLRSQQIK